MSGGTVGAPVPRFERRAVVADGALASEMHPVVARVYAARAVRDRGEVDYGLAGLAPYTMLGSLDVAAERLAAAICGDERILVVGDFDADGATGCAVAVLGLRALGARHVGYLVPNRFEYGYGLTPEIAEVAAEAAPDLLVTVDNGVSSVDGVAAARAAGIAVIVTDHHLPGEVLPAADAIVNPNLPGDPFPSKALAGVGVVFYLLGAVRVLLRDAGWFGGAGPAEPRLAELLDLVALGTVADLVPLDRNNRILVAQGLARIRAGRCRPGLLALLEVAGRDHRRAVASDLAFAAGPRLNAAGRLADMALGIECLLCDDRDAAREMATRLDELNRERRTLEAEMQAQALVHLEAALADAAGAGGLPYGVALYDPQWHQGVIGILAARVRERVHRPVVAFAPDGTGMLKGSGRSIPGLHLRDALAAVDARHPGVIERFGGHAMAAGLTLRPDDLDAFRAAFDAEVERAIPAEALEGVVLTDGELAEAEISIEVARALRDAGPWGQGFPEPLFDGDFEVLGTRVVGRDHLKLALRVPGGRRTLDAIAFRAAEQLPPEPPRRARLAYRLALDEWNGRERVQLVVEHLVLD
ncbi:MAG: single-stranded-DNA-specific exonuclease RecJ [Chromatiales bacterium]|nr:single-stranded-DNA-specific exonuclease RecJ [Chromatiales bacterium]